MKTNEWTNIKIAIENMLEFIKQDDEDMKYTKEVLEIWIGRSELADAKNDSDRIINLNKRGREHLMELGLRPLPSTQKARNRTPNQVEIHGCPTNPCVGKQHCSVCGLHGRRQGDGHQCQKKMG